MKYFDTFKEVHRNYFNRKMKDFDTFKKLPKNVCNLGKIIVATGFEKLPKVQLIAQFGHTECQLGKICKSAKTRCNVKSKKAFCTFYGQLLH